MLQIHYEWDQQEKTRHRGKGPKSWELRAQETEGYPLWREETKVVWYAGRQVSIMNQGRSDQLCKCGWKIK